MSGQLQASATIPSQKEPPLPLPRHSCATWVRVWLSSTAGPTALQEKLPCPSRELNPAICLLYTLRYIGTKKTGQLNRIVTWLRVERKGSGAEFSAGARDCFPSTCEIRSFTAVNWPAPESDQSSLLMLWLRMSGAILQPPHISAWLSQEQLHFYLSRTSLPKRMLKSTFVSNWEDLTKRLCELQDVESNYLYSSQIKVTSEKNVVG